MALPGDGTCWAFLYAVIQLLLSFLTDAIGWCSRRCDSSVNGKRLVRDVDPRPGVRTVHDRIIGCLWHGVEFHTHPVR